MNGGLLELKPDDRDLNILGNLIVLPQLSELPPNGLGRGARWIKDQKSTNWCTAASTTAVSEDQENVPLSMEFQMMTIYLVMGEINPNGADLRSACKALVKYGSLPERNVPKHLRLKSDGSNMAEILNPENWPDECFRIARAYAKGAFVSVQGPYDTFDNIRAFLYKYRDRTIEVGALWRPKWTSEREIFAVYPAEGNGHAFKIFDWKGDYLKIQQSYGDTIGEKGVQYMHRNVVNATLNMGLYTFIDLTPDQARAYQKAGVPIDAGYLGLWLTQITNVLRKLLVSLQQK